MYLPLLAVMGSLSASNTPSNQIHKRVLQDKQILRKIQCVYLSLLAVVRSLSPSKMELAPARKAMAWSPIDRFRRPADSRTTVRGITMRAVAMHRTRSMPEGGSRSYAKERRMSPTEGERGREGCVTMRVMEMQQTRSMLEGGSRP